MVSTEAPAALPIDVRTLDTDNLRRLIQQSRTVLRDRQLIPDATLRKTTTPKLTDDERAAIRRTRTKRSAKRVKLQGEVAVSPS